MAPNLPVSDQELTTILAELENDLGAYLAATNEKLSKAREEDGTPSPGMGSASSSPSSASGGEGPSASAPAGSPSAPGSSPVEGAPAEAPPAAPTASPEMGAEGAPAEGMPGEGVPGEGAPAGEPGMEGPVDPAALEAEYAKLPPEELKAHYLAAKAALFSVMGGQDQGAPPPEAAPSAPAAPPASPAPAPSAPPMAMSEMGQECGKDLQAGNGGEGAPAPKPEAGKAVGKAEASASSPSASSPSASVTKSETVEDLKAQLEVMAKIVNIVVGKPLGKAITGLNYVPKAGAAVETEPKKLSKAEITTKLAEITRKADLKKSDRNLIDGYYDGEVKLEAIEHLLK